MPRRAFLHVEYMADACVHVMNLEKTRYQQQTSPMCSHINIGLGQDITIQQLAQKINGDSMPV